MDKKNKYGCPFWNKYTPPKNEELLPLSKERVEELERIENDPMTKLNRESNELWKKVMQSMVDDYKKGNYINISEL